MKTRSLVLAGFLVIALVTAAVWKFGRQKPVDLTLTTGPPTGTYHPLGKLIAEAIGQHDTSLRVQVQASAGSLENMQRLASRQADLAIVQNDTPVIGTPRTLVPLHRGILHFFVRRDASIHSLADLRGQRVGIGPISSGSRQIVLKLLEHFGIELADLAVNEDRLSAACRELSEGELDALLFMGGIDSQAARDLTAGGDVRYVSLASTSSEGNEIDAFAITHPYIEKYTIPMFLHQTDQAGAGQPEEPCVTFSVRSTLIARADLPEDVAKTIVAAVLNERASMMRINQAAVEITEDFSTRDIQFRLHDGARAYYQRRSPTFVERYAEPMAFALSVLIALIGLATAASRWIMRRKKNRVDTYYARLDALLSELTQPNPTGQRLDEIDKELISMRHQAVRELVNEELIADESFRIFQSLLTDCQQQAAVQRKRLERVDPSS